MLRIVGHYEVEELGWDDRMSCNVCQEELVLPDNLETEYVVPERARIWINNPCAGMTFPGPHGTDPEC